MHGGEQTQLQIKLSRHFGVQASASCTCLPHLDYGNVLPLLLSTQAMKLLADMVRAHLQSNFYKLSGAWALAQYSLVLPAFAEGQILVHMLPLCVQCGASQIPYIRHMYTTHNVYHASLSTPSS